VGSRSQQGGSPSLPPGPVIEARGLSKRFGGRVALEGVSLSLGGGEVLGCVGPNGAGKTTTLRILVGTETRFGGELSVQGLAMPRHRRRIYASLGYMPQDVSFGGWRSAGETLRLLGRLSGMEEGRLAHRVPEALDLVGLAGEKDTRLEAFSGGMRQRLGLAQALLHGPRVLVLDEPFNHLDPSGRVQLKGVLAQQRAGGVAILFSSHILADVEEIVDRLAVIQRGRIVFQGTADELKRRYAGAREIEIGVSDPGAAASLARGVAGVSLSEAREDGTVRVRAETGAGTDAVTTGVLSALIASGHTVRHVKPLSPGLEEIVARLAEEGAP
jgi:ABC-2 type transport system ATP-binding protein